MKKNTFGERLRNILSESGMTQEDLVISMGSHKATVSKWANDKVQPGIKTIKRICEATGASFNYLKSGKGDKFENQLQNKTVPGNLSGFTLIPKYKAKLSGGDGSLETSNQIEANLAFRTDFISKKGTPNKMALFEVAGDSMLPFLHDGDVVLVDLTRNEPQNIIDGKVYAFREDHTVKVKRLSFQGSALIATSENSSLYPPYEVEKENFQLIGQVVWVGHEIG